MLSRYSYSFDPADTNNTAAAVYRAALDGGPRILDLGSGPGIVARMLVAQDGRLVTCVDADAEALAEAARAGVQQAVAVDLQDPDWALQLPERAYDVVILADVLEHLVDPGQVLRCLIKHHVIADDGLLVVSFPNIAHKSIIIQLMAGNFEYQDTGLLDSTHLRFFTRKTMHALLESTGFLVTETHRTLRDSQLSPPSHILELNEALRKAVVELDDDHQVYQYVLKARPSLEAATIHALRNDLQSEQQARAKAIDEMTRLKSRVLDIEDELGSSRENVARVWVDLMQARADAQRAEAELKRAETELERIRFRLQQTEAKRQQTRAELEKARTKRQQTLADLQKIKANLQHAKTERQRVAAELSKLRRSRTYRAGLVVRYLLKPTQGLRAVNRRRKRKITSSASGSGIPR